MHPVSNVSQAIPKPHRLANTSGPSPSLRSVLKTVLSAGFLLLGGLHRSVVNAQGQPDVHVWVPQNPVAPFGGNNNNSFALEIPILVDTREKLDLVGEIVEFALEGLGKQAAARFKKETGTELTESERRQAVAATPNLTKAMYEKVQALTPSMAQKVGMTHKEYLEAIISVKNHPIATFVYNYSLVTTQLPKSFVVNGSDDREVEQAKDVQLMAESMGESVINEMYRRSNFTKPVLEAQMTPLNREPNFKVR